ncbi:MAG: von Willebrand factor, type [Candidatus Angelobacter sp.]|nr:von Willebrand factor, type [Candidatus Angelobacter sp.]
MKYKRLPVLVFFLSTIPLWSQEQPTFSSQVKVVNVPATVQEKKGVTVRNLTKDDFVLEEDGHPQTIRYFTRESDLPLTLGLLVDTSMSQRGVLEQERTASHSFLNNMMRPEKDTAFIIHFDKEVELLQDVTSSRDKLETALEKLEVPDRDTGGGGRGGPGGGGMGRRGGGGGGGTMLYDSVFLAADEVMKKQQGRKALIILTDGVDEGSKLSLEKAVEAAQRGDTVVYSILFADKDAYGGGGGFGGLGGGMGGGGMGRGGGGGGMGGGGMGRRGGGGGGGQQSPREPRPNGKKVMERISNETGGSMFEVSKKLPLEQIYARIEEELRSQYSLGFTPDKADATAGYHKIHLTTKQKGLTVRTRDGYYAD